MAAANWRDSFRYPNYPNECTDQVEQIVKQLIKDRDTRGITLDAIADRTKISCYYLRAIEELEWDKVPGGLYRDTFLKNYAEAIDPTLSEQLVAVIRRQRLERLEQRASTDKPAERSAIRSLKGSIEAPPRLAEFFVDLILSPAEADKRLGDRREVWSSKFNKYGPLWACIWYWKHTLSDLSFHFYGEIRDALATVASTLESLAQMIATICERLEKPLKWIVMIAGIESLRRAWDLLRVRIGL